MSRPKPWLKLWTEWIHDPKILSLTLAEAGAWCKVLTLAQELQADGHLVRGSGNPLSLEEIATSLHFNNRDLPVLSSMFTKMEKEGSISREDGIYTIVNFEERQSQAPSETKDAVRERVRRYRERLVTEKPLQEKKETTNNEKFPVLSRYVTPPLCPPLNNPPLTPPDKDKDKEGECNGNVTEKPLQEKKLPDSLAATTPASRYLFEKTNRKRWSNLVQKEQFERCESEVGATRMLEAIDWALTSGIANIKSMITVARKKATEKGADHGQGKEGFRERGGHPPQGTARTISLHPIISGPDDEETGTPY